MQRLNNNSDAKCCHSVKSICGITVAILIEDSPQTDSAIALPTGRNRQFSEGIRTTFSKSIHAEWGKD
jgi:hypothetical protein